MKQRMHLRTVVFCLLGALVAPVVSAVNYPVGTFIVHGLAKNERNLALGLVTDDEALRIQALATNGTVLAESAFRAPAGTADPDNFQLEVPLTFAATDRSAAVGDAVRLCLAKDGVPSAVLSEPILLTSDTGTTNLVMQLYETITYTNKSDGQVVTVAADYVRSFAASLPGADPFAAYDPFADSDGDGASNYFEYLAGTNPFAKDDKLRIRRFARSAARDAITFEYVGGVVYGVSASPSLERGQQAWQTKEVATDADATPTAKRELGSADVNSVGEKTFYLLPTEKASSMFYKLEVK